jgi:hypothetical protein
MLKNSGDNQEGLEHILKTKKLFSITLSYLNNLVVLLVPLTNSTVTKYTPLAKLPASTTLFGFS